VKALVIASIKGVAWPVSLSGLSERVFSQGVLGVGDIPANPARPYIQVNLGESAAFREVRDTSRSLDASCRVYVYDDMGSFTRINDIHRLVRETLEGLGGTVSPSGRRCTACDFSTLGGEDVLPDRKLNVRVATYRITGPQ
jgi:hypothetical protein